MAGKPGGEGAGGGVAVCEGMVDACVSGRFLAMGRMGRHFPFFEGEGGCRDGGVDRYT